MNNFRLIVALAVACAGCAAEPAKPVRDFLDAGTGVTVTSSRSPIVLYRDDPAKAAYARNLVDLGPIEVNRQGSFRYFLWVGIWNTDQTGDWSNQRDGFESIVIVVDGEPMPLELAGWTPDAIGASRPVYTKPVATAADAYYPVTIDQLRHMAEANDLGLRTTGTSPREFLLWGDERTARRHLRDFVRAINF